MINDFFGLSKRILRYNEDVFFKSSQLSCFAKVLINASGVDHKRAAKETTSCLKELLTGLEADLANGF